MSTPTLILASSSIYRRDLLQRLRLPFEALTPDIDETALPSEAPLERARRLALAKAGALATRHPDAVIIGSDQVAVCKGTMLDKPGSAQRCREQLQWLSGAAASFHTAVAVVHAGQAQQFVDITTVYLRALDAAEIERYVAAEQPFDCAGGFRCEGLGISLFTRIVSEDPSALVGLPLIGVARALRQLGFDLP